MMLRVGDSYCIHLLPLGEVDDRTAATLSEYFKEIRALPRVSAINESELLAAWRRRDDEAAKSALDRAFRGYLDVTALLALHLAPPWMSPIEAIQEANLVLMRLVEDPAVPRPIALLTSALVKLYGELNEPEI